MTLRGGGGWMSVVPTFWLGSLEKHERLRTLVACERQAGRTGERMLLSGEAPTGLRVRMA